MFIELVREVKAKSCKSVLRMEIQPAFVILDT